MFEHLAIVLLLKVPLELAKYNVFTYFQEYNSFKTLLSILIF